MRPTDKIKLATIGDLHLTLDPPVFRSNEKDWLETQARYLTEVTEIVDRYDVPLAITGDIFDDGWRERKCPPALINFALKYLPRGYAVAGQHDLPHHRLDQIERSGYWTLVQAGKIEHIPTGIPIRPNRDVTLYGFSWGEEVVNNTTLTDRLSINVAVIHAYCWKDGHSFPGCDQDAHVSYWEKDCLAEYDAAVFGDNHKGFIHGKILNGGTFMRRKRDEESYQPFVGLLTDKGEWRKAYLNTGRDKMLRAEETIAGMPTSDFSDFIELLGALGDSALDFDVAVEEACRKFKVSGAVKSIVTRCLQVRK